MTSGLSFVTYTGVAAQQTYSVTFPALRAEHIYVDIDGVNTADISVNTAKTQVTINTPAIAGGEFIKVYRITPNTEAGRLVDFEAGGAITEEDLDTLYLQLLYIVQEALDASSLSLGMDDAGGNYWDGDCLRLTNIDDPVDDKDAVNLRTLNAALVDNGNLPVVTTDDNDSMLLVVAGAWAVSDPDTVKTALGLDALSRDTLVVVNMTDTTGIWQDSTITTVDPSFPDRVDARIAPASFDGVQFNNGTPNVTLDAGNSRITLAAGIWRITAHVVIRADVETNPPTVQWAVTDDTDDGGTGHANTVYMYGQKSEVSDTTPDLQDYMESKTVIVDFATATSVAFRAGSSGTLTDLENTTIEFERLGDSAA